LPIERIADCRLPIVQSSESGQSPIANPINRQSPIANRKSEGVQVTDREIRMVFANGVALEMPLRDKRLVGITRVSCRGKLLRNPQAPPLSPVVETVPARPYSECVYEGWEKAIVAQTVSLLPPGWQSDRLRTIDRKEGLVIHSTLRTADGTQDQLDWLLAPISQSLAGRKYEGLRYGYRFASDQVRVRRIMDRATWEVGGRSLGLQVSSRLLPVSQSSTYCLECAYRFVGADSFDYQGMLRRDWVVEKVV
jgi:hypothetical protein